MNRDDVFKAVERIIAQGMYKRGLAQGNALPLGTNAPTVSDMAWEIADAVMAMAGQEEQ